MEAINQPRHWLLTEGLVFLLLGLIASALPGISTLSIDLLIGWLFFLVELFNFIAL